MKKRGKRLFFENDQTVASACVTRRAHAVARGFTEGGDGSPLVVTDLKIKAIGRETVEHGTVKEKSVLPAVKGDQGFKGKLGREGGNDVRPDIRRIGKNKAWKGEGKLVS